MIQLKRTTLLLFVAVACFGFSPMAQALLPPPPPDGGYPNNNTAEGDGALFHLTTGVENTAVGSDALQLNTTGNNNTAIGRGALNHNTTGDHNTANGVVALFFNTSGGSNTATGFRALVNNRGSLNTAMGADALFNNTTAFFNTAMGFQALYSNTTGLSNAANGYQALFSNQTGGQNTASGVQALYRTTGDLNIALGFQAGINLTTGDNNIDIGNAGVAGESNKIRIGKQGTHNGTFIAGISGVVVTGSQVVVNAMGKLGVATSSARFKEDIKPMGKSSEAILALKPVTFRYKKEIDADQIPQFGLIAEEVAAVNPDLIGHDVHGKINTVRYEAVSAMLLNEFLKEHRKNEKQEAIIAELKSAVTEQQKQIESLTARVQKVRPQLEMNKLAPQTVLNNH